MLLSGSLLLLMEILDNFLPFRMWDEVYQTFLGNNFPWYYYPFVTDSEEDKEIDKFQFVHIISDLNKDISAALLKMLSRSLMIDSMLILFSGLKQT